MMMHATRVEVAGVRSMVTDVVAGATSMTAVAGLSISMAVLIFSGDLSPGLPRAAGAFTVATGVMVMWLAVRSQIVPVTTTIQDGPGMVVAALAADFAADDRTQLLDVFVLLALISGLTGAILWLLGRYRLGLLVKCMPATVIGGFIAGTGWLLFKGGFDVMVGMNLGLSDLPSLLSPELGPNWLPGLALGLFAWSIARRGQFPPYAVGLVVFFSVIGFYGIVAATSSISTVENAGWLIGPFPNSSGVALLSFTEVGSANWLRMLSMLPGVAGVAVLTAIATLLNVTGIAAQRGERIDLDQELCATGMANLVVAPLCASPGFASLGGSELLHRLGARRRAVPFSTGLVFVFVGIFAVGLIGYLPRIVPGAVLIFSGVSILEQWGSDLLRSDSRVEQLLSLSILLVIAWFGIVPGIGAGLVAACAVFTVQYSRVDPIRMEGSGHELHSALARTPRDRSLLHRHADRLMVFQLQGYLFFGSASTLERRVRAAALDPGTGQPTRPGDVLALDFTYVTGVGRSASGHISGLVEDLSAAGITVVLSSLSNELRQMMSLDFPDGAHALSSSLNEALELLEARQAVQAASQLPLREGAQLWSLLSAPLRGYFTRLQIQQGQVLARQGTSSSGMFVIESGLFTAYRRTRECAWGHHRRIGTLGTIGHIGLITGAVNAEEVVADTKAVAWWLSADHYRSIRNHQPALLLELQEFIMRQQTEQVIVLSEFVAATQR